MSQLFAKRHYDALAAIIKDFGYPPERQRIAEHFARELSRRYSGPYEFKHSKWMNACGVPDQ